MSAQQLESLLLGRHKLLPGVRYEPVAGRWKTRPWVMGLIQKKKTTISRLPRMILGAPTEKTRAVFPKESTPAKDRAKAKGHGRKGAKDFPGAERKRVEHPEFKSAAPCPACEKGKLYEAPPSRMVRIPAQPLFPATIYEWVRLRCNLCGQVFRAPAPPEARLGKYDPKGGLRLGLMRFGSGRPHYRMEKMPKDFGVPLPQSTQWELMEESARGLEPVRQALTPVAAAGELLHNDDTPRRVPSLKKQRAGSERTGIFTPSIVSQVGPHQIALFFTGGNPAGENLDRLLQHRAVGLDQPIQRCDALSRNRSKELDVLLANWLPHGRRNFVDGAENFPAPCQKVLESLGQIFKMTRRLKNSIWGLSNGCDSTRNRANRSWNRCRPG